MSDRYESGYPEDEPVIGGYPSSAPPLPPPGRPHYIGGAPADDYEEPLIGYTETSNGNGYASDEYEEDEYEEDEYEYYGDDEYYESAPARQPMFYVFVALAALVGGIVIFLLFSLVNNGETPDGPSGSGTSFAVSIDSPPKDKRIEIGKTEEVIVQASATEAISRFELFVGDKLTDTVNVTETPPDNKYRAVMKLTLTAKGNYDLMVKVTASSGATKESSKVRVIAIEPVGERPQTIRGQVVADTILRTGPGDNFPESGTLSAGLEVTILGKSKAVDWLLIDSAQGGRWAKRSAINPFDSLDLVPARDVTPTPVPTQPPTSTTIPSSPSPSVSVSPSPNPNSPDFVPTNAILIDGGSVLRVTVQNVSNNAYKGALVVGISGDMPGAEVVIEANLAANGGSATLDFDIPAITTPGKKAVVAVDPKNLVKELREDNNGATFVLLPPEEAPVITIQTPSVTPSSISITILNSGGPMAATNVLVRVKVGGSEASESKNIALAKGQTATFATGRPGTGAATAEVVINGQVVATANFTITP